MEGTAFIPKNWDATAVSVRIALLFIMLEVSLASGTNMLFLTNCIISVSG